MFQFYCSRRPRSCPVRRFVNSVSLCRLFDDVVQTYIQAGARKISNTPCDVRKVTYTTTILQDDIPEPFRGVQGWHIPQRRSTQRRLDLVCIESLFGPGCHGRDDGRDEDANGDDGAANGHHGLDQFFLPGVCPQCVTTGLMAARCSEFLVKLPFPLTLGFKSMLQRGIETPDMDVRWVSSLSWYFLNFFGLNGLYRLILGGDNCACFQPRFRVLMVTRGFPSGSCGFYA